MLKFLNRIKGRYIMLKKIFIRKNIDILNQRKKEVKLYYSKQKSTMKALTINLKRKMITY